MRVGLAIGVAALVWCFAVGLGNAIYDWRKRR